MLIERLRSMQVDLYSTVLMSVALLVLALMPVEKLPPTELWDKWQHVLAFAALVLPLSICRPHLILWTILYALFLGALIEILQPYFGRFFEAADFLANGVGVTISCVISVMLRRYIGFSKY